MSTEARARHHIHHLADHGMTQRTIAKIAGVSEGHLSKFMRGGPMGKRAMGCILATSPGDTPPPDAPTYSQRDEIIDEWGHFVGRCGWTDEKYAEHMATILGCTARHVLQTVEQHQRDTFASGLCRREVDTLSKIAAGFGDVGMGETWAVTSLEQMGCVTTHVIRGRGRVRVAEITEEGRRRLSLARRMEHTCQS